MLTVTMASLALDSSLRDMVGGVSKLWYARMLSRRVHGSVWVWCKGGGVVAEREREVGRDCWGRVKRGKSFSSRAGGRRGASGPLNSGMEGGPLRVDFYSLGGSGL